MVFDSCNVLDDVVPISRSNPKGLARWNVSDVPHGRVSLSCSTLDLFMLVSGAMDCKGILDNPSDAFMYLNATGSPCPKIDGVLSSWLFHVFSMFVADVDSVS